MLINPCFNYFILYFLYFHVLNIPVGEYVSCVRLNVLKMSISTFKCVICLNNSNF